MSSYFIFNNIYFAEQMFGALVFAMTAWLAFDAYTIRKDFLTSSRGIGFIFLVISQIFGAFSLLSETYSYTENILRIIGLVLVLWNLILEKPVKRPELNAVIVLPSMATAVMYFNFWEVTLLSAIAFLSYKQYKNEDKKSLLPFIFSFSFLAVSSLTSFFYTPGRFDTVWIFGHMLEVLGLFLLAVWVWQYLKMRIREMLLMIFFSGALLVSIVVTLAFSMILVRQIELAVMNNLTTNIKLADYLILHLKEESLSKSRIFASTVDLREYLAKNDFGKIEKMANSFIAQENLSLLNIADKNGDIIIRANRTTRKEDNVLVARVGQMLEDGYSVATIDSESGDKFSIKALSPVLSPNGSIMGYVVAGFVLDNPFVDSLKKITGLDFSVYDNDKIAASTIVGLDGRTRISGTNLSDRFISDNVLKSGKAITLSHDIVSRPFVSSYVPLRNINDEIAGMLSVSRSQREMFEIASTTNMLTLISVIVIMALLAIPIFRFSKKLLE
jgi:hypothetical protein